jgi:hypothetical protein
MIESHGEGARLRRVRQEKAKLTRRARILATAAMVVEVTTDEVTTA